VELAAYQAGKEHDIGAELVADQMGERRDL
jgi:hypothetical protein